MISKYIKFDSRDKATLRFFNSIVQRYKPDLIIIDSLVRFMTGNENDEQT